MDLPGLCYALPDGRITRDAVRDGLYLIQALRDGDITRATAYVHIGADLTVVEAVRPLRWWPSVGTYVLEIGAYSFPITFGVLAAVERGDIIIQSREFPLPAVRH